MRSLKYLPLLCLLGAVLPAQAQTQDDPAADASDPSADEGTSSRARGPSGLGIAPGTAQTGDMIVSSADTPVKIETGSTDEWAFEFHGFLRVPLRIGFGTNNLANTPADMASDETKLHAPPQIPDGTFTDWAYTGNLPGPWTELRFSYGNSRVSANVQIGGYNVTDAGFRNLQAQLGINEAFITLDFSDLFGADGGIQWTVGGFSNRYGGAGKYDAGKYDTYIFGRTHTAGETLTVFYHLNDSMTLTLEHGIGGKLEPTPLVSGLPEPTPPYLPYPGPEQQGTTLVHHAHLGLSLDEEITFALHYMTTWTDDAGVNELDGRLTTLGAEVRLDAGIYGLGFLGLSHVESENPLRLAPALEILHSIGGGWNLRDNFFGTDSAGNPTAGNGSITTLAWQYTYSLATLLYHPQDFWGQAPDLLLTTFGMLNLVDGTDPDSTAPGAKLKLGFEATYTLLSWMAISGRWDLVQPNMDDSTYSFQGISPRVILRSDFLAHEQVMIQYTRYLYGDNVRPGWPHQSREPDTDVFMISASMWW